MYEAPFFFLEPAKDRLSRYLLNVGNLDFISSPTLLFTLCFLANSFIPLAPSAAVTDSPGDLREETVVGNILLTYN